MSSHLHVLSYSLAAAMLISLSACNGRMPATSTQETGKAAGTAKESTNSGNALRSGAVIPSGTPPSWAPGMKPEMLAVIEKLASYRDKPIETLTAAEARKNHTPADAVMDLMKENHIIPPAPKVDTMGKSIPVMGGSIHIRVYTPKSGAAPFPVIVYYHGGGFVIADIDTYSASAQGMAEQVGAIVVSVGYRLAPENKFPAAHQDAFAAYQWVVKNAASLKGDPSKIAVMGESAGGNLAANVSIMARDKGVALPVYEVLVYPVAGADMTTASYKKNAAAKPLNKPMMGWFVKNYLNSMAQARDYRINLVGANLKGLEPTTIITDEIDPLQSEGMNLAQLMKAAGVDVSSRNYDGVTHEFFGMAAIVPQAKEAQAYAAGQLKKAFRM